MRKSFCILLVALCVLAVASCSSSRKAVGGREKTPADLTALLPVLADKGNWQTMKIPVSISLKEPVSARIGGTMTLVRGREIRLSFRFFGMEVAAASITGDSVKAYVKVRKIYLSESIESLLGGFPASVDNLQSLLLARLFQPGSFMPEYKRCTLAAGDGTTFTVIPPVSLRGLECLFTARTDPGLLESLNISYPGGYHAEVNYSYPRNNVARIPDDISLSGACGGRTFRAGLGYSTGDIDRSASVPAPFVIPTGYTRVSLSSLVSLLDNL